MDGDHISINGDGDIISVEQEKSPASSATVKDAQQQVTAGEQEAGAGAKDKSNPQEGCFYSSHPAGPQLRGALKSKG